MFREWVEWSGMGAILIEMLLQVNDRYIGPIYVYINIHRKRSSARDNFINVSETIIPVRSKCVFQKSNLNVHNLIGSEVID